MASIKGKLFEYFVYRLLISCGFKTVNPDDLLVYKGGPGLMVQGIGQPHNADVLLSPPIQTPFYYPTRLIVECKCYKEPIGLPQVRNALGLRDDINNFEIVTEDILRSRKSNRSKKPKFHDMKRYVYQVAVASIDGYKSTAYPFAKAHRIPLISFSESAMFDGIRRTMSALDDAAKKDDVLGRRISSRISEIMLSSGIYCPLDCSFCDEWNAYISEIESIEERITIGLLDDGTIIFLLQAEEDERANYYTSPNDGCTIHWSSENDSSWILANEGKYYFFELPRELYSEWKQSVGEQRRNALKLKQDHFSKIILFHKTRDVGENISIIHLSKEFLSQTEARLDEQDDN